MKATSAYPLRLPNTVWAQIKEYQTSVGATTLSEAIRRLVIAGLKAEQ